MPRLPLGDHFEEHCCKGVHVTSLELLRTERHHKFVLEGENGLGCRITYAHAHETNALEPTHNILLAVENFAYAKIRENGRITSAFFVNEDLCVACELEIERTW